MTGPNIYLLLAEADAKYTACLGEHPHVFLMHPATMEALKREVTPAFMCKQAEIGPQPSIMGVSVLTSEDCPRNSVYVGMRADLIRP